MPPADPQQHSPKFYLTTPIYYVNARPHIGHAYTTIVADVLARRHRLLGHDTFFLTGTDEHGQKIERSAAAAGIPPQQFTNQVSAEFRQLWDRMGLTYNKFIRTTDPAHNQGVQELFRELYNRGFIYLSTYTGSYCVSDEAFVDLPAGTPCPDCGRPLETVTEENFFFKLSEFQLPLLNLIESNALLITPDTARNEVLSFLRGNVQSATDTGAPAPATETWVSEAAAQPVATHDASSRPEAAGRSAEPPILRRATDAQRLLPTTAAGTPYVPGALKDLSVSRSSFTWGIPVPADVQQASGTAQNHVIYVWLDALANYMTAIGYGSDNPEAQAEFGRYWPADLHLVGKEITRFHCVYWPAFLLALNPKLQHLPTEQPPTLTPEQHGAWANQWVPKQITANGWLLFDNAKMSKSRGNVVRTETILDAFGTLCPPVHLTKNPVPEGTQGTDTKHERTDITKEDRDTRHGDTDARHEEMDAKEKDTDATGEGTDGRGTASAVPKGTPEKAASAAEVRPPTPHERDLFAADVLRYFLLREIPFGQDGSFSFDALVTRYNADLANGYGNLVSRTLNLIHRSFKGTVPAPAAPETLDELVTRMNEILLRFEAGSISADFDNFDVQALSSSLEGVLGGLLSECQFSPALNFLQMIISSIDQMLTSIAPWKADLSTSEGRSKAAGTLYVAAEAIRIITALLHPFAPYATARVWQQLGLRDIEHAAKDGELSNLEWGGLKPGTKLGPLAPIFPRADKGLAQIMIDMEDARNTPAAPIGSDPAAAPRTSASDPVTESSTTLTVGGSSAETPTLPTTPGPHTQAPASGVFTAAAPVNSASAAEETTTITIDDFLNVDLRVAEILVAERIPKADKLLRLEVDLGPNFQPACRQILSGIAQWYTPEELIGRRIVVVANLAPRKMRGLDSHGMLLAASESPDGKPILATFGEDIALGSRVR